MSNIIVVGVNIMKTVYCDVVFAVNFVMDLAVLFITGKRLRLCSSVGRMMISAISGGIFAVLCALLTDSFILKFLVCVPLSALLCYFAFGRCRIYAIVIRAVYFMIVSSVMFGGINVAASLIGYDFVHGTNNLYVMIAAAAIVTAVLSVFTKFDGIKKSIRTVDVDIELSTSKKRCTLLVDSANLLTDPFTSLPVIILKSDFCKIASDDDFVANRTKFIPVRTAQSNGIIKAVSPSEVRVVCGDKRIKINASVGFSSNKDADFGGFDGIIPGCLIENI